MTSEVPVSYILKASILYSVSHDTILPEVGPEEEIPRGGGGGSVS